MQGLIKASNFKNAVVSGEKEIKKGLYRSWVVYVKLRTNGRNNSQQCCWPIKLRPFAQSFTLSKNK